MATVSKGVQKRLDDMYLGLVLEGQAAVFGDDSPAGLVWWAKYHKKPSSKHFYYEAYLP